MTCAASDSLAQPPSIERARCWVLDEQRTPPQHLLMHLKGDATDTDVQLLDTAKKTGRYAMISIFLNNRTFISSCKNIAYTVVCNTITHKCCYAIPLIMCFNVARQYMYCGRVLFVCGKHWRISCAESLCGGIVSLGAEGQNRAPMAYLRCL